MTLRVVFVLDALRDLHIALFNALSEYHQLKVHSWGADTGSQLEHVSFDWIDHNAIHEGRHHARDRTFVLHQIIDEASEQLVILPWQNEWLGSIKPMIRLTRGTKTKLLLWGNGYDQSSAGIRGVMKDASLYAFARRVDAIIVHTSIMKKRAVEIEHIPDDAVYVCSFGIDTKQAIETRSTESQAFQENHHLSNEHTLLYKVDHDVESVLPMLQEIIFELRKSMPAFKLIISGPQQYHEEINVWGAGADIEDALLFIDQDKYDTPLSVLCDMSTLLLYPGAIKPELIQCMAHGLPPLIERRPREHHALSDLVQRGETGLVFQKDDTADAVRVIREYVSQPSSFKAAMRDKTSVRVHDLHDISKVVSHWNALISSISDR